MKTIKRDYWAIKKWLADNNIKLVNIKADLGVHISLVSATIRGLNNNKKVLNQLIVLGCPKKFL